MKPSEIASRYRAGETIAKIAAASGMHSTTVRRWLRNLKVEVRPPGPRKGTRMPPKKRLLTPERMAAMYREGQSCPQIAKLAGVHETTVRRTIKAIMGVKLRQRGGQFSPWNGRLRELERAVCDAWVAGDSIITIQKDLHCGHRRIRMILDAVGFPHHRGHRNEKKLRAAELKEKSEMTAEEREWMRESAVRLYEEGMSKRMVAHELGIGERKLVGLLDESGVSHGHVASRARKAS